MDEILASIRKIISDDLGETTAPAAASGVSLKPEVSADVLELSSDMALPVSKDASWNMPLGRRDAGGDAERAKHSTASTVTDPVAAVTELAARMAIISSKADRAVGETDGSSTAPVAPATESAVSSAFGCLKIGSIQTCQESLNDWLRLKSNEWQKKANHSVIWWVIRGRCSVDRNRLVGFLHP